jgi:hypothetical protein
MEAYRRSVLTRTAGCARCCAGVQKKRYGYQYQQEIHARNVKLMETVFENRHKSIGGTGLLRERAARTRRWVGHVDLLCLALTGGAAACLVRLHARLQALSARGEEVESPALVPPRTSRTPRSIAIRRANFRRTHSHHTARPQLFITRASLA